MEYSGVGGKLIHEKNQKQKISWHCPFRRMLSMHYIILKVHKNENFFGFDFEFCTISVLVMHK